MDPRTRLVDLEDSELVRLVAAGDRDALAALYTRHAGALLGVALSIVRQRQEAEDLVHDVFLEAWHTAAQYDPRRGRVGAWLAIRMRSRALDRVTSARVRREVGPEPLMHAPAIAERPALDGPRLRAALARLPIERQRALELAYFEGLSCTAIAEKLAIPIGTVKSRLAAGLRMMRAALDTDGDPDPPLRRRAANQPRRPAMLKLAFASVAVATVAAVSTASAQIQPIPRGGGDGCGPVSGEMYIYAQPNGGTSCTMIMQRTCDGVTTVWTESCDAAQ